MKVPPKPPTYTKDRTLTRRTVKGAAGGMIGVDYEDPRNKDINTVRAHTERASAGKGENRDGSASATRPEYAAQNLSPRGSGEAGQKIGGPKEEQEMILDDEDANTRDAKKRQRQQLVTRDRLTVDKDAPELRRSRELWAKVLGEEDDQSDDAFEEEPPSEQDPEELDADAIGQAITGAGDRNPARDERLGAPASSRLGDPSLVDPQRIRRALKSPIAYAKHVMVLAQAFRVSTGARREEVIAYMAAMYAALPDRGFSRQALKEFGPGTGILDVYPLEVIEEIVLEYPGLLPKVGFGKLLVRPEKAPDAPLELVARQSSVISYPTQLKVRGFALKGGASPGYLFEPDDLPGRYHLRIDAPGSYALMVSGVTRSGYTIIDRIAVHVHPSDDIALAEPKIVEAPITRNEEKVAQWPIPEVPPIDPHDTLAEASSPTHDSLLSVGELAGRRVLDSARGPKGEDQSGFGVWLDDDPSEVGAHGFEDTTLPYDDSLEETEEYIPPEEEGMDERLSNAEQAVLRLAFATQVTRDDLVAASTPRIETEKTGAGPIDSASTDVTPAPRGFDNTPTELKPLTKLRPMRREKEASTPVGRLEAPLKFPRAEGEASERPSSDAAPTPRLPPTPANLFSPPRDEVRSTDPSAKSKPTAPSPSAAKHSSSRPNEPSVHRQPSPAAPHHAQTAGRPLSKRGTRPGSAPPQTLHRDGMHSSLPSKRGQSSGRRSPPTEPDDSKCSPNTRSTSNRASVPGASSRSSPPGRLHARAASRSEADEAVREHQDDPRIKYSASSIRETSDSALGERYQETTIVRARGPAKHAQPTRPADQQTALEDSERASSTPDTPRSRSSGAQPAVRLMSPMDDHESEAKPTRIPTRSAEAVPRSSEAPGPDRLNCNLDPRAAPAAQEGPTKRANSASPSRNQSPIPCKPLDESPPDDAIHQPPSIPVDDLVIEDPDSS